MSVIGSNALAGASGQGGGGFVIEKSLRFKGDSDASLTRTPTTAGSQSAFTLSTWVKRSLSTTYEYLMWTTTSFYINFTNTDKIDIALYAPDGSSWAVIATSQARFRDPSAWYHIVVSVDSSAGTANSDRLKLWVNGEESPLDYTAYWGGLITGNIKDVNTTIQHEIGARNPYPCDFYLADYYWIDGQGLTQNDFGEFDDNNVWRPKEFTGTYGTNGFHLDFADGSNIGNDAAGSNNWTANNLTTTGTSSALDLLFDSPSNGDATADTGAGGEVSGNYCTLNPLDLGSINTLSDGNLKVTSTTGSANWSNGKVSGTIGLTSGKWYWEYTQNKNTYTYTGIGNIKGGQLDVYAGASANSVGWLTHTQTTYGLGSSVSSNAPSMPAGGGTIMVALDLDNGKIWWGLDGTWVTSGSSPNPATGTDPAYSGLDTTQTWFPLTGLYDGMELTFNFGQRAFAYTAPSGYKAICTANLPTPDVPDGSDYFDAALWTGNGTSQSITGLAFSPDFVWVKGRNAANGHNLQNIISGTGKFLQSHNTNAEGSNTTKITAFNSDGFSLGSNAGVNNNNDTYVGWAWDAGDSNTSVSAGSLNSTLYDQSQTWSTYGTFDNNWSNSAYHWDDVFNTTFANNGDGALYVDGTTKDTWNLSSSYAVSNTIKVYVQNPTEITINEGLSSEKVVTSDGGTSLHFYEFSFTGNVESVGVRHASGGGIYLMGIWFDGKQLVDDTETVANVPSIASTVRANPSAGFSIVSYTGSSSAVTVGHGLNAAPEMIIVKDLDTNYNWQVNHVSLGADESLILNTTATKADYNAWNDTRPTSTVFSLGAGTLGVNSNGNNLIAYCFAPVAGYSAFGSYTGNGLADGPFVYTGFKPKFILIKRTDAAGGWNIVDTTRSPHNVVDTHLYANEAWQENYYGSVVMLDILSNGFKFRSSTTAEINAASGTHIYAAFSENPFQANGGLAR